MTRTTGWLTLLSLAACVCAKSAWAETPLERGTYLVRSIVACGNCHTPKGPEGDLPGQELAGMANVDNNDMWTANGSNITPDTETGIGNWSAEELAVAIREGRRPDGTTIGPPMPFGLYRQLSDEDLHAIVTYVQQVPAVSNAVPASEYRVPLPPNYGPPVEHVPSVSREDTVAYGAYLAGPLGHCIECHSPLGPNGPDMANNLGAGGFVFNGPWGQSVSSNITPTGLERWSDEEIKAMITQGQRPDGSPMKPPMPYTYYANMTEEDLNAIVAYLRQLPRR